MLGFAWLTLRQAEEALKTGRLEEAHRLLGQPAAQGHKRSWQMLRDVAQGFVQRGQQRARNDDLEAAWHDLLQAEQMGRAESDAGRLRQDLIRTGLAEARMYLKAGEPARAAEELARLKDRGVRLPEQNLLEDAAKSWLQARDQAGQGDFALAIDTTERVRRLLKEPPPPLEQFREELSQRHRLFTTLLPKLHEAAHWKKWREALELAEQVLAVAPRHPEARQTRALAWKAVDPSTVAPVQPPSPLAVSRSQDRTTSPQRYLLWVDGVGGFLVCLGGRVTLGQATSESYVDIPLFADVSRLHASLTRDEEGYLLEGTRPVQVNGQTVANSLLRPNDRITLGTSCQFQFRQPAPISTTARLDLVSGHRLPLALDAVILMADTLLLGAGPHNHVALAGIEQPVVLYRHREGLAVRYTGSLVVNDKPVKDRAVLGNSASVKGDDFAFSLEPAGPRLGQI
jgi:hypothetical protein